MPMLERFAFGGLSTTPPRISTPLGMPVASAKRSPLTPTTVAEAESPFSMSVTFARPISALLERTGLSA